MELYDNCCVWVSHWEMIRHPGSVKARRVRRAVPVVYAGTVYTFCQLGDELTAFKGWTWKALVRTQGDQTFRRAAFIAPGRGRRLPKAFGNLVWARVRGLCADRTRESMALLDLEQIARQDGYDPYVQVMHAYPRDYGNEGVYAFEIVSVSGRAMRIIHKSDR